MRLDRLNEIEQFIMQKNTASLEEISQRFGVSLNTVRRDVHEILKRGKLKKVYGGVAANLSGTPLPMSVRAAANRDAKQKIGQLAATLIPDGSTLFLDSGSTTVCVLPFLTEKSNITIVSHSLPALYEASQFSNLRVIALGGVYSDPTASYVGASTLEALSRINLDMVLIAATGVSLEKGLTNTTYFEADIKRLVTSRNSNIVLLADHSKFDHAAPITFCDFDQISALVSDQAPPQAYQDCLKSQGALLLYEE